MSRLIRPMLVLCVYLVSYLQFGCSLFQRSPESGYAMEDQSSPGFESRSIRQENLETQRYAAEMGFSPDESLSASQWRQIQDRQRLRALESKIDSQREREQYSKILPWLTSDLEKIDFLTISTLEGRQAWINSRGIWSRARTPADGVKSIVESGDIAIGMQMDYVKKSWGEPQSVEVSGNPAFKNERWKYTRFVSSQDGYKQERRYVYFEGGRVVGWETD